VTRRSPTLADPADPLGKLQRGLGSGDLWALDAARPVAHALLLHCVFNDPRWDRQLDDRDDYYATIALDVELDVGALEVWLADGDDDIETTSDVIGVLGRMAIRGHAGARRVLREYVSYGRLWERAIDRLIGDYEAMPAGPWPEAVAGLDAVLVKRFPTDAALAEALAGVDSRARPWTLWSVESPKIASALALDHGQGSAASGKSRKQRARSRAPRPREMSTVALLAVGEGSRWTQVAEELETRTGADDVARMLAAARDPALAMRPAAILALGRQGRREVLEIAAENTAEAERGKLQGAIALALEAMEPSQTRALAHDWLTSADWARRRKAAGILAAWAGNEDLGPARDALARELDRGLDGDVYVICSLAEALGRCSEQGPFEELTRAYDEIPYSYGRRYVVSALAAADPTFAGDVAVECLWDCEAETRRLAAAHVDRRVRLAAQRLAELGGDEAQAAFVRQTATDRL